MDGEAQIRGTRRKAENSRRGHRELRDYDYPQIEQISQILRDRICLNLRNLRIHCSWLARVSAWDLCVSVVKIRAKQSQFPGTQDEP